VAGTHPVAQPADHLDGVAPGPQRFTHQDPGFLDVVVNKNPEVTRIYLPPDVNCLLATPTTA